MTVTRCQVSCTMIPLNSINSSVHNFYLSIACKACCWRKKCHHRICWKHRQVCTSIQSLMFRSCLHYRNMENYHVLEIIGEGSFGKVYKGRKKYSSQVSAHCKICLSCMICTVYNLYFFQLLSKYPIEFIFYL